MILIGFLLVLGLIITLGFVAWNHASDTIGLVVIVCMLSVILGVMGTQITIQWNDGEVVYLESEESQ